MPQRPAPGELPRLELGDREAWTAWLEHNHGDAAGVWLLLAKQGAPRATVTQLEAIEVALCFGWIDGQLGRVDEHFYRVRFTPRRAGSAWSRINRDRALALIEAGLMRAAGLAEVERARADGRWEAAYEPQSKIAVPDDFRAALDANPAAATFFETLTGARRYAFLYRIGAVRRPQTRAAKITQYVELLAQGRTLN